MDGSLMIKPRSVRASNSMLTTHARCVKKALLKTAGYGPAQPEAKLEAGRCAHLALAEWLTGNTTRRCLQTFADAYRPFADQFVATADRLHYNNLEQILEFFFDNHKLADMSFELVESEKQIEAEVSPGRWLSDRSDGIVRQKTDGSLWALEWKTTNRVDAAFVNAFKLDPQNYTHIEVARRNGFDVVGVIIGAIQFGKLPQRSRRKCRVHLVAQEDCREAHHASDFFFVQPPPASFREWGQAMRESIAAYQSDLFIFGSSPGIAPETGRYTRECYGCWAADLCYSGDKNLGRLTKVPQEEEVLHSGWRE